MDDTFFLILAATFITASMGVFFGILNDDSYRIKGLIGYFAGFLFAVGFTFGIFTLKGHDIEERIIKDYLSGKYQVEYRYKEESGVMVPVDTVILFRETNGR